VDECGQCVLGTTGREFNAAKDCAGQCFGGRLPTDPYDRTIIILIYTNSNMHYYNQ
jgi:hypothetical protein